MLKGIGYSFLGIILFYIFLLVQFPYEVIKEELTRNLANLNLGKFKIGKVSPSFPLALSLQNITWSSENLGVQIPDLMASLNIIKTIIGYADIEIKDLEDTRRLQARYYLATKEGSLRIRLDKAKVEADYKNDYSFNISLSGDLKLQWVGENYEKIDGEFWTIMERGEIEVRKEGSVPLFLMAYNKIRAEGQVKEGNFWAKRLVIAGKEGKEIVLSDLNLTNLLKGAGSNLGTLLKVVSFTPPKR